MRFVRHGVAGMVVVLGVACSDGSDRSDNPCIADHPRDGALGADNENAASVTEIQCAEVGQPCESDDFISRAAAECIARKDGLEPGIGSWAAMVVYHHGFSRPVWNVQNLLEQRDDGCRGGSAAVLDAITGEVLMSSTTLAWGSCP